MASKLIELLNSKNKDELTGQELKTLLSRLKVKKEEYEPDKFRNAYDGIHEILNRETKTVEYTDESGKTRTKSVEMNKLVFNYQQKIVETALAFLFGEGAGIERDGKLENDDLFTKLKKTWKRARMDYKIEDAVRDCMIETKSALLMYLVKDEEADSFTEIGNNKVQLRIKVLSHDKGDSIFPHFDENGKMDAFIRELKLPDTNTEYYSLNDPTTIEKTEIYTKDWTYHIWRRQKDNWIVKKEKNEIGKIPVIYFDKEYPEWDIVESLINRIEWLNSKHSDSNDYFAFPALVVKGDVRNLPSKNEVGKLYEIDGEEDDKGITQYNGGVDTLTWEQSPESIKNEYEKLISNIYSMTHTPDISFENLKGMSNVSGIALKLMFLDAKVKARNNKMAYGEKIDRVINVFKEFCKYVGSSNVGDIKGLPVTYRFEDIIPESDTDLIDNLVTSAGTKPIISQKTAAELHPYVEDSEQEQDRLDEDKKASKQDIVGGGSFNL